MSFLSIAKFDGAELLSRWCTLNDIAILDCALTSSNYRELFLYLLGLGEFIIENENTIGNLVETGVYDQEIKESRDIWISKRGLKIFPRSHCIFKDDLIPPFDCLQSLKSIMLKNYNFSVLCVHSLSEIVNSFPNLTCIQLLDFTVDQINPTILKQLRRFTIDGCYCSIKAWDLVGLCPNLEVLPGELYENLFGIYQDDVFGEDACGYFYRHIRWKIEMDDNNVHRFIPPDSPVLKHGDFYFGDSDDESTRDYSSLHKHILNFLKHMPNITIIDINDDNIVADDTLFIAITKNCPNFRKLNVQCNMAETDFHSINALFFTCKHLQSFDICNSENRKEYVMKYRANDLIHGKYVEINQLPMLDEEQDYSARLNLFFTYNSDFHTILLINIKQCEYQDDDCYIDSKLLQIIISNNPNIHSLYLSCYLKSYNVNDVKCLLDNCTQLHTLRMNHRNALRNSELCELFAVPNNTLTELDLCMHKNLTSATMMYILDKCPNVHTLGVDLCYKVKLSVVLFYLVKNKRRLVVRTSVPYEVTVQDTLLAAAEARVAALEDADTTTLFKDGYLTLEYESCESFGEYSDESEEEN